MTRHVQAVVIGAGPTGATAAIMLAQRGIECLVLDRWPEVYPLTARGDRAAGRLCPQPRLHTARGDVPLDQALGDGFAIITRGRDRVGAYDPATRRFFEAIGTRVVHLGDGVDPGGTLTALLDAAGAEALLVRPDRVVAASADRPDLRTWRRLLESAGVTMPSPGI